MKSKEKIMEIVGKNIDESSGALEASGVVLVAILQTALDIRDTLKDLPTNTPN